MSPERASENRRILVLGGTGTIGRAAVAALVARGYAVCCPVRPRAGVGGSLGREQITRVLPGAELVFGDITDPAWLERELFRERGFDAILSCLASRTGAPGDAWAIDYQAHLDLLALARQAGVEQMVLLSAICVQKPRLAFQHAKLAFEQALIDSGLGWSIVRPTAYFKSLAGQLTRLRQGKPFLVFGDGELTACKPISAADLAAYLADCLDDASRQNRILPIGGPGPAITPGPGNAVDDGGGHPGRARQNLAAARGKGRAGADRALLRHRIDAALRYENGPLRRRGDAGDGAGYLIRVLSPPGRRRGDGRARRSRRLLTAGEPGSAYLPGFSPKCP